jgi:phenylalanine-4-hydroxylase
MYYLAFKLFPATQYMRHSLAADYNSEPDVIHDVFGHVASLTVPEIAELH